MRARTAELREGSRTLTPPNTQTQKAPCPHFSLPYPLELSPICLFPEPQAATTAGLSGLRPARDVGLRRSAGKKCRVGRKAAVAAPGAGGGVSLPPNCQRTHPQVPQSAAGRAGPYGSAAAGCSGWVGSAQSGRSGGAERAGLGEGPRQ